MEHECLSSLKHTITHGIENEKNAFSVQKLVGGLYADLP